MMIGEGVYFLLRGETIVYIGRSAGIWCRLKTHQYKHLIRSGELTFGWVLMGYEQSRQKEKEWIRLIRPALNIRCVPLLSIRERLSNASGYRRIVEYERIA